MDGTLTIAIEILQAVALLVLGAGAFSFAYVLNRMSRSLERVDRALDAVARDAGPVLDRARAIGENLNYIVMSVRKDVERASETVARANDRLEDLLEVAEDRVQELNALIEVVQDEVEDTVITATSALKGIRTGARILARGRRRGDDAGDDTGGERDEDE